MKTRIVTTNPAGYTVAEYNDYLTIKETVRYFTPHYDNVSVHYDNNSIPKGIYLLCFDGTKTHRYQIKYD